MSSKNIFDQKTLIPVGLVLTLLAASFSFGVMYHKVEAVQEDVTELKTSMKEMRKDIEEFVNGAWRNASR